MLIPNKHCGFMADGTRRAHIDTGGGGGGSTTSTGTTYTSPVPEWLQGEQKDIVARGMALAQQPYQAYGGERVSQFTPLQRQAFGAAERQGVAGQLGTATGLAGLAGTASFRDPGTAGSFMNPFIEQALAPQLQGLARQAQIEGTRQQGEATMRGAFGGSRDAIMRAEREKNLLSQQGDVLSRGYAQAFDNAQQQFNAERAAQLQAAGQLGALGQTQFGQEMDIMGRQREFGADQQAQIQRILDQRFADFQAQRDYPYQQIGFMSDLIQGRGGSTRSVYSQPGPNPMAQLAGAGLSAAALLRAEGGEIPTPKKYAVGGGITGLLPDDKLQERMDSPTVATIAKMAAEKEMMDRARMREGIAAMQQGVPQMPTQTVAEEMLTQMGIGGLPVPDEVVPDAAMAGGGIVAFSNGTGDRGILSPSEMTDKEFQRFLLEQQAMDSGRGIAAGPTAEQLTQAFRPTAAPSGIQTGTTPAAAARPTGIASLSPAARMAEVKRLAGDGSQLRERAQQMGEAEIAAREADIRELQADQAEGAEFWTDMRKKVESKVEGLSKDEYDSKTNQLLTIGAALLATDSPNFGTALGQALGSGVQVKVKDEERIRARKDALDARMDELAALERGEKRGDKKELRAARSAYNNAKTDLAKALYQVDKDAFDRDFELAKSSVDAFAKEESAARIAGTYAGGRSGAGAGGMTENQKAQLRDKAIDNVDNRLKNNIRLQNQVAKTPGMRERLVQEELAMLFNMQQGTLPTGAAQGNTRMRFDAQGNLIQ